MRLFLKAGAWIVSLALTLPALGAELDGVMPGHWLEVRGNLDEKGVFVGERVDLVEPEEEEVLIGTISESTGPAEFMLLNRPVQISEKTSFSKVDDSDLPETRVKVEGHYRGAKRFSARKISARGPGRDRLVGPISEIRRSANGYRVTMLSKQVYLPSAVEFRHDKPVGEYTVVSLNVALPQGKELSEEDQFGEGLRIGNRLRFSTLLEGRYKGEDNYDLDDRRERGRQDTSASLRGRFILQPGEHGMSGQLEVRYSRLRRNEDPYDSEDIYNSRLGESFVFWDNPFGIDFDLQAGRMDFDDRREWLYDQNLDGLRLYWKVGSWLAELSATTTLSDGKLWDENTDNYIAYFTDRGRNFSAYVIHRDTDFRWREKVTHLGVRGFGSWPPRHDSWLEISHMHGRRDNTDLKGWGFDMGTTRKIGRRWYLTAAWAYGQGDANNRDGTDGNFRQTGLQDNNGKFGGVTSFRYYGELVDPELANLHIGTLGIGFRFAPKGSIDLVGHYYRQDKAVRDILDSDIDQRPDGINRELGWEVDAIVGWRPVRAWDFEFVVGWFKPGEAFRRNDDAWISKFQIRYRY